ncbi:MAG TPA: ComF family protein [Candidatus Obscuribacterales bacterium]
MLTGPVRTIGNLFLQQPCPLCDRPTPQAPCAACWRQLQPCALGQPASSTAAALPILAWGQYQGLLKRAIAALKYEGQPHLAVPLGQALGHLWQQFPVTTRRSPLVVPIPMYADKQRERGFNQAALLAAAFCHQTGLPLVERGLVRQRATAPQFGLGLAARQQNLAGAFIIGPAFQRDRPSRPVFLIDDIYTTGTTALVAAATLRRHGISVCGVGAIARAQLEKEAPPIA